MKSRNLLVVLVYSIVIIVVQIVQAEEAPAPAPAPATAPAVTVNQAGAETPTQVPQPGNSLASGSFGQKGTWNLTKVKVTGAILSVEFEVNGESCENHSIPLQEISFIDENTAKKFTVLKDEGGQWMAGPLFRDDVQAKACGKNKMWLKFPAPPAETKTITLNMSQLGSLDSIPVQR